MAILVDVVNFNCDASCLESRRWLAALVGGKSSELYQWASLFVRYERPVVLGFTGATLADVREFNPETLALIDSHPGIFGAVLRPFSHDIHLLRRRASFTFNLQLGWRALEAALPGIAPSEVYLPPEFMLTGEQVGLLAESGIPAVFINPQRFSPDRRQRIPRGPYRLRGLLGATLGCIPMDGRMTQKYLDSMHRYEPELWNEAIRSDPSQVVVSWRDGESFLLVPDGIRREEHWLANEAEDITRRLFHQVEWEYADHTDDGHVITHFPVHSFAEWMKEFRMLGYLGRLGELEDQCLGGSDMEAALWLALINSDVLSAVEKRSVHITLRKAPGSDLLEEVVLHRTSREFEAEEFFELLRRCKAGDDVSAMLSGSTDPHLEKLRSRVNLIADIRQA